MKETQRLILGNTSLLVNEVIVVHIFNPIRLQIIPGRDNDSDLVFEVTKALIVVVVQYTLMGSNLEHDMIHSSLKNEHDCQCTSSDWLIINDNRFDRWVLDG